VPEWTIHSGTVSFACLSLRLTQCGMADNGYCWGLLQAFQF
jgi:hypothetical protein